MSSLVIVDLSIHNTERYMDYVKNEFSFDQRGQQSMRGALAQAGRLSDFRHSHRPTTLGQDF